MAQKRSRAAFEADLQAQQSPFVFYGTPLPPLDPDIRDDGTYVPVWKQSVTDERGRKRLHGAFTGGFSAGYFNTVGSKEGWTPSTFVSSRANRQNQTKPAQQRPEDFMDEEDLADAAEAQLLETTNSFTTLGGTGEDANGKDIFTGLGKVVGDTMGIKLLQRMGWRPGQGIGPKIRRTARLDEPPIPGNSEAEPTHLFAPENSAIITFARKNDHKGLGYQGEGKISTLSDSNQTKSLAKESKDLPFEGGQNTKRKQKTAPKKTGFGVGILNDTGSDDDDPYEMGPRISYNRVLGAEKKPKKLGAMKATVGSSNPLINARPIFKSKTATKTTIARNAQVCHDGRPPLKGFILSTASASPIDWPKYLPKIPPGWKSSRKTPSSDSQAAEYQSVKDAAKSSSLDPKGRATILGESALPGKSVFDYLSAQARDRLALASGKGNLPPALGEAPPAAFKKTTLDIQRDLWDRVPLLPKEIAAAALSKGTGGWMPYAEDEEKRARYSSFLELRAGLSETLPVRAPGMTVGDWVNELQEFVHAAQVFKPITGMMATRFTSSTSQTQSPPITPKNVAGDTLLRTPAPKPEDPAEQAAKLGMYGPMTRSTAQFFPTRLVCKRFNITPPAHVQLDPGAAPGESSSSSGPHRAADVVSKASLDEMLKEASLHGAAFTSRPADSQNADRTVPVTQKAAVVDIETNDALEAERAGEAVFRAIFGSDDEES